MGKLHAMCRTASGLLKAGLHRVHGFAVFAYCLFFNAMAEGWFEAFDRGHCLPADAQCPVKRLINGQEHTTQGMQIHE